MEKPADSDEQLQEIVRRRLQWSDGEIHVRAKEGAVTLTGFVHGYSIKIAAEEAAKTVFGVRSVGNEISLKPLTGRDSRLVSGDNQQGPHLDRK